MGGGVILGGGMNTETVEQVDPQYQLTAEQFLQAAAGEIAIFTWGTEEDRFRYCVAGPLPDDEPPVEVTAAHSHLMAGEAGAAISFTGIMSPENAYMMAGVMLSDDVNAAIALECRKIIDEKLGFEETVERMTKINIDRPYLLARHISGYVFGQLIEDDAEVTQYQIDTLRHDRYYNQPSVTYGRERDRFVGKNALNYALAAYNAFTAGPRHSLAKRYNLQRSERVRV